MSGQDMMNETAGTSWNHREAIVLVRFECWLDIVQRWICSVAVLPMKSDKIRYPSMTSDEIVAPDCIQKTWKIWKKNTEIFKCQLLAKRKMNAVRSKASNIQ